MTRLKKFTFRTLMVILIHVPPTISNESYLKVGKIVIYDKFLKQVWSMTISDKGREEVDRR